MGSFCREGCLEAAYVVALTVPLSVTAIDLDTVPLVSGDLLCHHEAAEDFSQRLMLSY